MKKISLILATALAFSMLAGCSSNKKVDSDEKVKLTYWAAINVNAISVIQNYDELLLYKELEDKFNVDLVFKHPPAGQETEQFNLMITSMDLPDLIEHNWLQYKGGPGKAISDGVIQPLNDIIANHAPNLKAILEERTELKKELTTEEGDYYVFPSLSSGSYSTFGGSFLRKDWLDDLGLSVPETIDEWENVLIAFKEKKGATAPYSTIKEYLSITNTNIFNSAFDVGKGFYVDNGVVKYGPAQQGYKEYIATLKRWFDMGLIDEDIISTDWKNVDAKILSGKTGATTGAIGAKFGKYLSLAREQGDMEFELVAAPQVVKNKGDLPRFVDYSPDYNGMNALAFTVKNNHVNLSARVFDYLYSEEGALLKNFGVEGQTYTMEDGNPKYTDLIMKNPDGLAIAQAMAKYFRANTDAPGISNDPRYLEQYYAFDSQKEAIKVYNQFKDRAKEVVFPEQVSYTTEQATELAAIMSDIDTYKNEMFVKFLLGTEDLSKFDEFVENMMSMGLEKVISIRQDAYNRYQNK